MTLENNHDDNHSSEFFGGGDTTSQASSRHESIISSASTFRDTEIEEDTASNLMKIQNLTSIVNDPKGDSFMK